MNGMKRIDVMDFRTIPQFPQTAYRVDIPLSGVERNLDLFGADQPLVLCPDFQRGHVWTRHQQEEYVWYLLQGGEGSREIYWNSPKWENGFSTGPITLVDGLQRLTAVRNFISGELRAHGFVIGDFPAGWFNTNCMSWRFFALRTKIEVLDWYLTLNAGGTPHTPEEIERVRKLKDESPEW